MDLAKDLSRVTKYFAKRPEVSALYIFGSAVTGRELAESDLDIAVLIDDRKMGGRIFESFKKAYYTASPTFSIRPVDIVILNTAPPFLKHRIIKTGKVLFDRNKRLRTRFAANAIIEYLDYKPIEDICIKAVAGRFRRAEVGR